MSGPTIRLAVCSKCSQPFVPADDDDLEHIARENGEQCLGMGWHADPWAPYIRLDPQPDCTDLGPFVVIEELADERQQMSVEYDVLGLALDDARDSNRQRVSDHYPRYYVERKDA